MIKLVSNQDRSIPTTIFQIDIVIILFIIATVVSSRRRSSSEFQLRQTQFRCHDFRIFLAVDDICRRTTINHFGRAPSRKFALSFPKLLSPHTDTCTIAAIRVDVSSDDCGMPLSLDSYEYKRVYNTIRRL